MLMIVFIASFRPKRRGTTAGMMGIERTVLDKS